MKLSLISFVLASFSVVAAAQAQHAHVSVGVDSGKLLFQTYGASLHYDTTSGYLVDSSSAPYVTTIANYSATGSGAAGLSGAFANSPVFYGSAFTLTTDYYTSSESPGFANTGGTYDKSVDPMGGSGTYPDINYQLVSLTPLNGASAMNQIAYNVPINTTGEPQHQAAYVPASSDTANNSLDYGYGNHIHGVQLFSLQAGKYAVGVVAHDSTARFNDSTPAYFVVNAVPEPASIAAVSILTCAALARRKRCRA